MKTNSMTGFAHRMALPLLLAVLVSLVAVGCQPQRIGETKGDEYNKAMSADQRAIIDAHKKAGEQ